MTLSMQEMAYFQTFGYLVFPKLLVNIVDEITARFEEVWSDNGGGHDGKDHDKRQRSALLPFIDKDPFLSALIDDSRIDGIAASLLGEDYNYTASDGNFYVGDTGWHSDGYRKNKYLSIKMAMYLDPVDEYSGCLRVIPGSHIVGDLFGDALNIGAPRSTESHHEELWGVKGSQVPAIPLESKPGDLVVFNHCLKHASFGGGDRRRMFTMNFQQRHKEEDLEDLKADIGNMARFWSERAYGNVMIETASPARMKHLEQRLANDEHLPDLVVKAKREMDEPSRR